MWKSEVWPCSTKRWMCCLNIYRRACSAIVVAGYIVPLKKEAAPSCASILRIHCAALPKAAPLCCSRTLTRSVHLVVKRRLLIDLSVCMLTLALPDGIQRLADQHACHTRNRACKAQSLQRCGVHKLDGVDAPSCQGAILFYSLREFSTSAADTAQRIIKREAGLRGSPLWPDSACKGC